MGRLADRVREVLDWRFLVALIVLILVLVTVWGFVRKTNENASLAESAKTSSSSISVLASRVDRLNDQLEAQRVEAKKASAHASEQRALLRKQNRALAHALSGLLAFLSSHGITIPHSLVAAVQEGGSGAAPRHHRRRHHSAPPQGPGNSGTHPCAHSRKC